MKKRNRVRHFYWRKVLFRGASIRDNTSSWIDAGHYPRTRQRPLCCPEPSREIPLSFVMQDAASSRRDTYDRRRTKRTDYCCIRKDDGCSGYHRALISDTLKQRQKPRLPANTELAVQRIFFFVKEETKTKK